MKILTFNGKSSADVGLFVGLNGNDSAPARSVETVVINGRNGTLTLDNGRYDNIDVTYRCFLRHWFDRDIAAARAFFLSEIGYKRLEDSAHPGEFRLGRVKGGLEVTPSQMREQGYFDVTFDCMPQRWLKSGEIPVEFTAAGSVYNPTAYPSKPLIRVYGAGSVGIGDDTLTITGTQAYTDIDSERMDAFNGATNLNSKVSGEFPVIEPGLNGVTLGGSVSRVVITPRWFIL